MKLKEALDRRKQTFYHASPKRLKVGTILTPGQGNYDKGWQHHSVFLTTKPLPHFTIAKEAIKGGWHIYEVEPLGKIERGMWDDVEATRATIRKYIGTARGISQTHKRKTKHSKRLKTYRKKMSKEYPDEDMSKAKMPFGSSVGIGSFKKMKKRY